MKKVVIVIFILSVFITNIFSCPACNIHNYLYSSIEGSSNIFLGKIKGINHDKASVEVLKVYKGNYKKGDSIEFDFTYGNEYISKEFIFSDPVSPQPNYPILQKELEDEVMLLVSKDKKIKDVKEAVKFAQGISTETKRIAFEYLKKNHKQALKSLIKELEMAKDNQYSSNKDLYYQYKVNNLVEAILLENNPMIEKYIAQEINNLLNRPDLTMDFGKIPYPYSSQAEYFSTILVNVKKYKDLEEKIRQSINEDAKWCKKRKLADLTYAVLKSEFSEISYFENLVKSEDEKNYHAVGLYYLGNFYSKWWNHEKALMYYKKALENTSEIALSLIIDKELTRVEKLLK